MTIPAMFLSVDKRPGGHSGELSIGLAGEAVEIWELIAIGPFYTTEDVRGSGVFPVVYETFHEQNNRLRLMPIKIDQDENNPARFVATLTYSSDPLDPKQEDEKDDDPLDRRCHLEIETGFEKEVRHRDFYGKKKVNTAGDLFDPPPESNRTYLVFRLTKNLQAIPPWLLDFADAVNLYPFVIKGIVIPAGWAWIAYIKLGDLNTDGPTPYVPMEMEMWIKRPRKPEGRETAKDVPGPWRTEVLNEGLMELVDNPSSMTTPKAKMKSRIRVADGTGNVDVNGDPIKVFAPGPVPLDSNGKAIDPPNIDNINYVVFRDHPEIDFSEISYVWSDL